MSVVDAAIIAVGTAFGGIVGLMIAGWFMRAGNSADRQASKKREQDSIEALQRRNQLTSDTNRLLERIAETLEERHS